MDINYFVSVWIGLPIIYIVGITYNAAIIKIIITLWKYKYVDIT